MFTPALLFAQRSEFTISGKTSPDHNGKTILLLYPQAKTTFVDSVKVIDGSFSFKGSLEMPALGRLKFRQNRKDSLALFLSHEDIAVILKDSLRHAVLSGGDNTTDFIKVSQKLSPLTDTVTMAIKKYMTIPASSRTAEDTKTLTTAIRKASESGSRVVYEFLSKNPDSYVSLFFLNKYTRIMNYETVSPHFQKLSTAVRRTPLGMDFNERMNAKKGKFIGSKAIPFESTTPEGAKLALNEVIAKGKFTFIDFWASWCGPCRAENPNVVRAYSQFHDKGFNILSVSLDTKADLWKAAIAKDGMPWYHVSSLLGWKEPVAALYGVRAIPQNILIDQNGIIIAMDLKGEALLAKLSGLLK
ncbi:TlpA disulfide reductase family protein [Pedobacter mucosus]|uniref:TlpA disulfide reductase family protein n=1 Tax=Pedobacter mucosus TaxID=2895286 RepID=UPI001EE487A4|nr:TlpA disulfide reductase family protein [Pedobacter mucosus]UKT65014.1 AhpC/TSA family protein [Pedobacter mucosus]